MMSTNLNTEVLADLTRLEDTLARLNVHGSPPSSLTQHETDGSANSIDSITNGAANLNLSQTEAQSPQPISQLLHYRSQPPSLVEAYTILSTGSQYIHATSTKYTLVSKIDYEKEGGNLAVELRKGAELIATATLAIFSAETGCGPSVKRYTKQYARGVVASLIALITSFHDGSALVGGKENQLGPQKTGAVWSACDAIQQLPKGNRNAMRRECMVWIRDCMESIAEFEEVMALGEREDGDEEEMYTAEEMKIVKASVNVMKCTKNVLGLVLKACDCVGDYLENSKIDEPAIDATTTQDQKSEILQWIHQLHELARAIGEGVTDLGILLYPPLDLGNNASKSSLANQVNDQLQSLEGCVTSINEASTPISNMSMKSCMSDEVVEAVEKLINGVNTRSHEVQSAW